jgi:hypothetical protein
MWTITRIGFFSIVQKAEDIGKDTLTIRARVREDLDNLRKYLPDMTVIRENIGTDYQFRARAPRSSVVSALSTLVKEIDYNNFKNEVTKVQGKERASAYSDVWWALSELGAEG